ncbi:MAG: DNA photolyase family protein [Acidimicrobiales bacterium]|jgi:deoxyribodipyrimidine photo-lyase|nr:DNA photolyase family protein [Acidimicrobiales bacterium]
MGDDLGLVWFRRDLRLDDNPAWAAATATHARVVALHVLDPRLLDRAGTLRRRRFLHDLLALDDRLRELGGSLRFTTGDPAEVVPRTAAELGAVTVHANADTTPFAARRDAGATAALRSAGVDGDWWWGTLVHEPGSVRTRAGSLSQVFTPFHRVWEATARSPWPASGAAEVVDVPDEARPDPGGAYPLVGGEEGAARTPGEHGALARLEWFLERVDDYRDLRDRPDRVGSSQLSPDLRFGTLSPRTVIDVVGTATPGRAALVRQLAWRDWYAHTLSERPEMVDEPLKTAFARLAWRHDPEGLAAWQEGRTGVPMVDAGMRQLRGSGWVHNRVRMIVGSFLTKNLLIDWRLGERWFRHHLVDGDVAQNVGNWQWVAGTGPDASPFHRVFNPVLQGRKFDPDGGYVRRWVPELAGLPAGVVHAPWEAGPLELAAAGVELGSTYPHPIVDLRASRERALAAYEAVRA